MKLDLTRSHTYENGIYDFIVGTKSIVVENKEIELEVDYAWDYASDPVITPTIIHEWKYLDKLVSKHVFNNARSVLSIGGGGSSRTHEYLSPVTRELTILNTGRWDLENAQTPSENIEIFLICATGEDMPILDHQIDAIEIPATLDHVINARSVIEESYRVLNSGGRIGITLGNSESWYRKVVSNLRIRVASNHDHHHNFHFTSKDVETLLSEAGFTGVKTIGTAYLKLPKSIERKLNAPILLAAHRFISDTILRLLFGNSQGGMFLTYGIKPLVR